MCDFYNWNEWEVKFPADVWCSPAGPFYFIKPVGAALVSAHLSLRRSGSIRRTPRRWAVLRWPPAARRRGSPSPNRSDPPCCRPTWTAYRSLPQSSVPKQYRLTSNFKPKLQPLQDILQHIYFLILFTANMWHIYTKKACIKVFFLSFQKHWH